MLARVLLIVFLAAVLTTALVISQYRQQPLHVSGFIEAQEIRVGSRVGGRVARVAVLEGASVKQGDVLLELEPYDLRERQAEARAQVAAKRADFERLSRGYRTEDISQAQDRRNQIAAKLERLVAGPRRQEISTAEARLELARAQLKLAQSTMARVQAAFNARAASQDDLDRATDAVRVAEATQRVRQEELDLLREGTRKEDIAEARAQLAEADHALELLKNGYRTEEVAQAKAALEAAQAALAGIERQLEELTVRAPLNAIVEAVELRPGDLIAPGAPALTLLDPRDLWVRAYVPENRLSIRDGQQVQVSVDALPKQRFAAQVTFIARQAEFTPGNVQTPEERSKQVFRIKVTLREGKNVLRAGMSADIWLDAATNAK